MGIIVAIILLYALCAVAALCNGSRGLYIAVVVTLIAVAALRPEGIDRDYMEYLSHFNNYDSVAMLEPTFKAIAWFSHTFFSSSHLLLFAIYAALGVGLKAVAIERLSDVAMLSLAIYISQFFILHEMTQIRAGVASALLLLAIKPLYERNWRLFFALALCATAFHLSGVIIFALWFISPHRRLKLYLPIIPVAIGLSLLGVDLLTLIPIPYLSTKIALYQNIREYTDSVHNQINLFNGLYLLRLALCCLLFWAAPTLTKRNRYYTLLLKVYTLSLAALPLFAHLPVVAYRVYELLGIVEIILIPTLIYIIRPKVAAYLTVLGYGFGQLMLSLFHNRLLVP